MLERIMGVFRLNVNTFEEIEADESATGQAALVVALVALLAGIGAFIGAQTANAVLGELGGIAGTEVPGLELLANTTLNPVWAFVNAVVGAFVAWLLWAALTYFIGTRLFNGQATLGEMLRVIGFAQAPRMLSLLSFIPCLGPLLSLIGWIWALAASFIGIRQGLDIDNTKTLLTIIVSWLVAIVVNIFILGPLFALLS